MKKQPLWTTEKVLRVKEQALLTQGDDDLAGLLRQAADQRDEFHTLNGRMADLLFAGSLVVGYIVFMSCAMPFLGIPSSTLNSLLFPIALPTIVAVLAVLFGYNRFVVVPSRAKLAELERAIDHSLMWVKDLSKLHGQRKRPLLIPS